MSGNGDIHAGHRQRMKERFLANGLEGFSPHEAIELVLYYAIPRRDVNELSHRLIERFGSYNAVFDADYEDLISVEGVGENVAILFKLMAAGWQKYAMGDDQSPLLYDSTQKIGNYAVRLFVGASVEKLYVMLFDNKMMLLDTVKIAEGTINEIKAPPRIIVEKAIRKNASSIVLLHNHPNGTAYPSKSDLKYSNYIKDLLSSMGIELVDHIIVSGRFYRSAFAGDICEDQLTASANYTYGKGLDDGVGIADDLVAANISYKGKQES